jgi:ribose transport system substrate-binding protein
MRVSVRFFGMAALAILFIIAATGCGNKSAQTAKKGTKDNPWIIGMSQCTVVEPWREQMNNDIKKAAEKHSEIKVEFKDADDNASIQQDQVMEFIQQGVDLIIISPKEGTPLTAPVAEAYKKGIPVIVLDREVNGDQYTCFIGGDNVLIGREAGKFLVKLLGGKGNVVELKGNMSTSPGQDRHKGFMEGIKGSAIKVVFSADCDWKQENAEAEMNSALSLHKDIDAVYAHNDPSAMGAYIAAKNDGKGREKTIKFIGIDGLPSEGQQYVRTGKLTATFEYPTCGSEAIETAMKILKGQKVPKRTILRTRVFTIDNVDKGGKPL